MATQQQKEEQEGGVVKRRKVAAAAAEITMDLDVLDCPICAHPLHPPIFQCTIGHTICSSCHEKLPDKCHFCSLPTVYSRCHMVEHIIESIKVSCSNANHGCTARITYYQKEDHEKGCSHAPCFCPEDDCSFSGPTAKLLDHFSVKHKLASIKVPYKKTFRIYVKLGGAAVLVGEDGNLFMVNVIPQPIGGVIFVCCIQPHSTGSKFKCRLTLIEPSYYQKMEFLVSSTNLRDEKPQDFIPFVVPKLLLLGTGASATTRVDMMVAMELMPQ